MLKKLTACFLCLLFLTASGLAEQALPLADLSLFEDRFAANPRPISNIGDPHVLAVDGEYFLFATGGPNGSDDINVWRSTDLVNFTTQKALAGVSWASYDYWAPEVYPWGDGYVMLYSARRASDGSLRVGIAFSDAPEGPYEDPLGAPLFDFGYAAIDASLFVDDDGTPYLLYSRDCSENEVYGRWESHSYGVRLSDDLMSVVGEPVLLVRPDSSWETISGEYRWNEGPSMVKHDGKYYLFYSANYYASIHYAVGVAVSEHPLGPYYKSAGNPIMQYKGSDGRILVSGTGHNSFFTVGGELFTSYHSQTVPEIPSDSRQVCVDRAGFHFDGTAYISGPTLAPQLKPLADLGLENFMDSALTEDDPRGLLNDGDICMNYSSGPYTWVGSGAGFSWEEAVPADMLLIYPGQGTAVSGRVILNGEFVLEFSQDADQALGQAVCLAFEPMDIGSLRLELDGESRIGELMLVG